LNVTDPVKWSPGRTVLLKFTGYAGYISYQEEYTARPPEQSASVPVCSTLLLPSPSRPTQKLEYLAEPLHVPVGSVQLADTLR